MKLTVCLTRKGVFLMTLQIIQIWIGKSNIGNIMNISSSYPGVCIIPHYKSLYNNGLVFEWLCKLTYFNSVIVNYSQKYSEAERYKNCDNMIYVYKPAKFMNRIFNDLFDKNGKPERV